MLANRGPIRSISVIIEAAAIGEPAVYLDIGALNIGGIIFNATNRYVTVITILAINIKIIGTTIIGVVDKIKIVINFWANPMNGGMPLVDNNRSVRVRAGFVGIAGWEGIKSDSVFCIEYIRVQKAHI